MIYFFSIAYGVIAGILSFVLLNGIVLLVRKATAGRIIPPNLDASEKWVVPPGGIVPLWMFVIFLFVTRRITENPLCIPAFSERLVRRENPFKSTHTPESPIETDEKVTEATEEKENEKVD